MSLEDEFSDVIGKAMAGLGMDADELAGKAGIEVCEISGLLYGDMEAQSARRVCEILNLDPEALISLPDYQPAENQIAGVRRIILPFRQWDVNAWLLELGGMKLLFDTGLGAEDILSAVATDDLDAVLITHAHEDHIGGVNALLERDVRVVSEVVAFKKKEFTFGGISLRVVDLAGHKSPAVGYFVEGFGKQLFIPGDAIFAGSMGGCYSKEAYELAFHTLGEAISQANEDCVILPGHGPATTVHEELEANPFRFGFS